LHASSAVSSTDDEELTAPARSPENAPRAPIAPRADTPRDVQVDVASQLREKRLKTIQALRSRYDEAKRGSDDEFTFGYKVLAQSTFAHMDFIGAYSEQDGKPSVNGGSSDYRTINSGREYHWGASDYPELAEMTEMRVKDGVPPKSSSEAGGTKDLPKKRLTDGHRDAIDRYYAQAIAELSNPKR
jgi:hypothetical protein